MAASIEEFSYQLTAEALREQEHAVAGLRSRAGTVLESDGVGRDQRDVSEAYRAVGIWIGPMLESNRDKIADLADWFTVSCGLLAVEVILWTVSLAGLSYVRGRD